MTLKAEIDQPELKRALDDLHAEFEQASAFIGQKYSGPTHSIDQGVRLIETYSKAVERIVLLLKRESADAGTEKP